MITIVDYGLGNLGSIHNMLRVLGEESKITNHLGDIEKATKLILPGVGAFDTGIRNIKERNLWELLNHKVLDEQVPILGICLGMQLMTKSSQEGVLEGFGWIDAHTYKFNPSNKVEFKIPHMGWNTVRVCKQNELVDIESENRFYFVHSYYIKTNNMTDQFLETKFDINFTSGFIKENIIGVQFHPEKSHKFGKNIFRRFIDL